MVSSLKPEKLLVIAILVFLAAAGTNLFYHAFAIDEYTYMNSAQAMADGSFSHSIDSTRFPFLPFTLSLFLRVLGDVELVSKLFSLAAGVAGILLTYALAKRLAGKDAGAYSAAIVATNPLYIFLAAKVLTEPLFITLFAAFALLVVIALEKPRFLAAAGGVLALGTLARFNALIFLVPAAVLFVWRKRLAPSAKWVAAAGVVFIVVLLPYLLFSVSVTGDPVGLAKEFLASQARVDPSYYSLPDRIPSNLLFVPLVLGAFAPVFLYALWKYRKKLGEPSLAFPLVFALSYAIVFELYAFANFALLRYIAVVIPFVAIPCGVLLAREKAWKGISLKKIALVFALLNVLIGIAAVGYFGTMYAKHLDYADVGKQVTAACQGVVFSNVPTVVDHYYAGQVEHDYEWLSANSSQCIFKSGYDYWGGPRELVGYETFYIRGGVTLFRKS
ncbi:hypothetical protein AUJ14_02960 [Candidatus Micrarchaeota archaeon CG1_02_55_22]|nr:MAG: hypothetical protein AUJ14_02960 [Candidatus Micrarchaeota archaeon CG1_02_55_22]